jgi:serine protease inhibitor
LHLNEKVTEAEGATHHRCSLIGGGYDDHIPSFKADHPFAFMLANRNSHILFTGIFRG